MSTHPPPPARSPSVVWLRTGAEGFRRMLAAIEAAHRSIQLEFYIFQADETGERFRLALIGAARRGVRVQVLLDAFGSNGLPAGYWRELEERGGTVRLFNPPTWRLFAFRDHRKLLLVDGIVAFVGGFNIGREYDGDGVTHGWRDLGWELHQPVAVRQLAAAFDAMFQAFDLRHRLLLRIRRLRPHQTRAARHGPVLLSGPRLLRNPFRLTLRRALREARHVQIISGYFVPTFRLRRALRRVARRGGTVELVLAGKSDVPVAQLAGRHLFGSLLRAGVRIFEYQPQVLHSKLIIVDNAVFVGSANLDVRSFGINYELMVCLEDPQLAAEARELFAADRRHAVEITWRDWRKSQDWLTRLRGLWACFVCIQFDPWVARRQLRART
jgi:cardiolipin synthase